MGFLEALEGTVGGMARGLEARSRRQAAIAANIANADTPGYRAVDVSFTELLARAGASLPLSATDPRHLSGAPLAGRDQVILTGGSQRRDGNDVDVDREMGKLAKNQIEYQFLARALGGKFRKLKEAITGRASA